MRCDRHGLACGPEGRCVLCRKEGASASRPPPPFGPASRRGRPSALVAAGVLLVVGAALAARIAVSPTRESARPGIQLGMAGPVGGAASSGDVHVVVYTAGWCPHCREAKVWMNANGVPYEERDVEASADYARMNRSVNPRGSIPTFDVDGDVMVGFSAGNLASMIDRAAQRRVRRN